MNKITRERLNEHLLYILPDYKEVLIEALRIQEENYFGGEEDVDEMIEHTEHMLERVEECLAFFYGE
jgi:hypothetical protein